MTITNLDQLRQAAAIVQPTVNAMGNATDVGTVIKCMETIKETVSAIYVYKVESLATKTE